MKKRSVANSLKRLERYTFLSEVSLGKRVPSALQEMGLRVVRAVDVLPQDAKDPEWAAYAGQHGMIVLTKDSAIKRKPNEVAAIMTAGIAVFTLARGNLTADEMIKAFKQALPKIDRVLQRLSPPFIVSLTKTGEISTVYPPERWEELKRRTRSRLESGTLER